MSVIMINFILFPALGACGKSSPERAAVMGPASKSYGLVELGGGSLQIAFIPEDPIYAGKMSAQLGGREYDTYGHSYLSYGATLMTQRIVEYLVKENPYATVIVNPCMLKGDELNGTYEGKVIGMVGGGNASLCEGILRHYLDTADADMCSPKPCTIGQVYQPPVKDTRFFTFGLVYIVANTLGVIDGAGDLDMTRFRNVARTFCGKTFEEVTGALKMSPKYASRNCQDGLYIPLIFSSLGFDPDKSSVYASRDIEGASVAWSIGAVLYEEEHEKYANLIAGQYMEPF